MQMWNEQPHAIRVRQLSQLLAYMSKFPTLLYYKMMGITPLFFNIKKWINSISLQIYDFFLNRQIYLCDPSHIQTGFLDTISYNIFEEGLSVKQYLCFDKIISYLHNNTKKDFFTSYSIGIGQNYHYWIIYYSDSLYPLVFMRKSCSRILISENDVSIFLSIF